MPVSRTEVTRPQPPGHRDGRDAVTNFSRNRHHQPDEARAAVTGLHAHKHSTRVVRESAADPRS